jgi:uncharacterized protein YeaO (DUF488 family)
MSLKIKRVYDRPSPADGRRVLVDRLWPRGLTKEKAHVDLWAKQLAPSTELRKWFDHDPQKWGQYKRKYFSELRHHERELSALKQEARRKPVTLVFSTRDVEHNNAVAIVEFLGAKPAARSKQ